MRYLKLLVIFGLGFCYGFRGASGRFMTEEFGGQAFEELEDNPEEYGVAGDATGSQLEEDECVHEGCECNCDCGSQYGYSGQNGHDFEQDFHPSSSTFGASHSHAAKAAQQAFVAVQHSSAPVHHAHATETFHHTAETVQHSSAPSSSVYTTTHGGYSGGYSRPKCINRSCECECNCVYESNPRYLNPTRETW